MSKDTIEALKNVSSNDAMKALEQINEALRLVKVKLREEQAFKQLYSLMSLPHQLRDYQVDSLHAWQNGRIAIREASGKRGAAFIAGVTGEVTSDETGRVEGEISAEVYARLYGQPIEYGRPRRGVIVLPTGTGKTLVGMQAMKEVGLKTMVIVPTEVLLFQWVVKLMHTGLQIGQYWGGARVDGDVMVGIYNTVSENVRDVFENFKVGMLIADEVHHIGADTFSKILLAVREGYWDKPVKGKGGAFLRDISGRVMTEREQINFDYLKEEKVMVSSLNADGVEEMKEVVISGRDRVAMMGLTASPYRTDGAHTMIFQLMPVVYRMTLADAMQRKVVAPLEVMRFPIFLMPAEWESYNDYTDTIRKAYGKFGGMPISELIKINDPLARAAVGAISRRKQLLANAKGKIESTVNIVKGNRGKKILVFSESIHAIETIHTELNRLTIPSGMYHSDMKIIDRVDQLDRWERGEFDTLLSVKCLEEGIDVPEVSIGVITASGQTQRQFIQRLGRILRVMPEKKAVLYLLYAQGTIEKNYLRILDEVLSGYTGGV